MNAPPIIDISRLRFDGLDRSVGDGIHAACLDTGFFVIVGHGLDDAIADLFAVGREFFDLPQAIKERTPRVDRYGYVPRASDMIDASRRTGGTGETEFLDVGLADEVALPDVPGFEAAIRRYQSEALPVATQLLSVMARHLGASPTYFTERMSRPQCRLRLLRYPPLPPGPDGEPQVPTMPHTDYGALTLLASDGVPGLEVLPIDGDWTPVEAPLGSFVVNLGDMLARWTNDVYRSTPHRVVASAQTDRYSIPFFVNPDPATIVSCIPSCVTEERPCAYEPIRAGDYLAARIDGSAEPYLDADDGAPRRPMFG